MPLGFQPLGLGEDPVVQPNEVVHPLYPVSEPVGQTQGLVQFHVRQHVVQVDLLVGEPIRSTRPNLWMRRTGFQCRS